MKTTKSKLLLGAVLALAAVKLACGQATCPSSSACITWTASTKNTDGTAIVGVVTYKIYKGDQGKVWSQHVLVGTTQGLSLNVANLPSGMTCFVATASVAGVESNPTNEACKFIRIAAPSDGKIESPSDGAIETR